MGYIKTRQLNLFWSVNYATVNTWKSSRILLIICLTGLIENGNGANVGEACTNGGSDCTVPSSVCSNSLCECDSTHFKASNTECSLKLNLKAVCTNGKSSQCSTANADCIETSTTGTFQCLCKATHFESNGACVQKIDLKTSCTSGVADQCKTQNADCIETATANIYQCRCKSGYYENSGECNEKKNYADNCTSTTECKGVNTECTGDPKKCGCKADFFADTNNDNNCTQKIALNYTCIVGPEDQCVTANAVCKNGTDNNPRCLCKNTHYDDNGACTEKKDLSASCTRSGQCKDSNAECAPNTCQCKDGFYSKDSVCTAKLSNGETCTASTECKDTNAECDSMCKCKSGFYQDASANQLCKAKIELNGVCSTDPADQCITQNSECKMDNSSSTKCLCSANYYEENNACAEKKALDVACSTGQCKDVNAECKDSKCQCKNTFYTKNATCSAKGGYDGACTSDVESCLYSLTCTNGTCVCGTANQFFERNTNTCKAKIALNGMCSTNDQKQCIDALAVCKKHGSDVKCMCSDASYEKSGTCSARITHLTQCIEGGPASQCIDGAKCITHKSEFKCVCDSGVNDDGTCNGDLQLVASLLFVASVFVFSKLLS